MTQVFADLLSGESLDLIPKKWNVILSEQTQHSDSPGNPSKIWKTPYILGVLAEKLRPEFLGLAQQKSSIYV